MRDSRLPFWTLVVLLLVAAPAVGARAGDDELLRCRFPEPPVVPEGRGADEDDMARAGDGVRAFLAAMQGSLDCLDAYEASRGTALTAAERAALVVLHNNGVDQMHAVADAYNAQLTRMREAAECGGLARSDHCVKFVPEASAGLLRGGIQH
ncbi:MAG TPA: hypothetical protein VLA56_21720 [Pseudomonadales bacterium]|nr:hypothetical protein [Pseudomonadales bacterium]